MRIGTLLSANSTAMCAVAIVAIAGALNAQAPGASEGRGGFGGGRGGIAPTLFPGLDTDQDGAVTRGEMESGWDARVWAPKVPAWPLPSSPRLTRIRTGR